MLTLKVGHFINKILMGKNQSLYCADEYRLYLVRDGSLVFYIGQSKDAVNRLANHIGLGQNFIPSSKLGALIVNNMEEAVNWDIDFLTIKDCHPIVREMYPKTKMPTANIAEKALIKKFCPCLNVDHNDSPTQLPDKYKSRQINFLMEQYLPLNKILISDPVEYHDPDNAFCFIDQFIDHKIKQFNNVLLRFILWSRVCYTSNARHFFRGYLDDADDIELVMSKWYEYLTINFNKENADEWLQITRDFLAWYKINGERVFDDNYAIYFNLTESPARSLLSP
jgi:hypothetical protein